MSKENGSPEIVKNKIEKEKPVEINLHPRRIDRRTFNQDQISIDKIVDDSESNFYITGRNTQIGLVNFLQLVEKHDINEVDNLGTEELVVSSELITKIATATVIDEDAEDSKYIDAVAIGMFIASLILGVFALTASSLKDLSSFALILVVVSGAFLIYYTHRGLKSGELKRLYKVCIKSLSKD